jgi:hypothetical protein
MSAQFVLPQTTRCYIGELHIRTDPGYPALIFETERNKRSYYPEIVTKKSYWVVVYTQVLPSGNKKPPRGLRLNGFRQILPLLLSFASQFHKELLLFAISESETVTDTTKEWR